MEIETALQRYLKHHRASDHSIKTVEYHTNVIRPYAAFLQARNLPTTIEALDVDTVRDWLDDQRKRGLSVATLNTRVRSLKAFARWLVSEEWLEKDPFRKLAVPKVGDIEKATLSPADVDRLMATCDRKTLTGVRDYALMMLLFSTGLRASELLGVLVDDVNWDMGLITIRRGKGKKSRVVPLGMKADKALAKYMNHPKRPDQDNGVLWLNDEGDPLGYEGLKALFVRHGRKAGVRANPHKWRHSAAIAYLRGGGRVENLRVMLGHSTLDMTLHYARIAGVDLSAAHETADPTRNLKAK